MISEQSKSVAERAKAIYAERLQTNLESQYPDKYVAVEPDSAEYFVGVTFAECIAKARFAYPDRLSFVIQIGHDAAIHIGVMTN